MTAAEFKRKWERFSGKESAAYQEHFGDLCRLLQQPTPAEADPSGEESFCFQKRVVKDAELFALHDTGADAEEPDERGFADVWKKGCFAWEYKGKKKNLDEAYRQLLRYRESLLNPPLLVVCDFTHIVLREEPPAPGAGRRRREESLTSPPDSSQSLVTSTPTQHRAAIAAVAKELNELRERWLNPREWTRVEYLEFPASSDGPWARYVECGDSSPLSPPDRLVGQAERRSAARGKSGAPVSHDGDKSPRESGDESPHSKIGLARYPRLVPKDAECAVKLKKRTLTNLYNERPAWLDLAHKKLDAAVAAAYGWSDLAEVLGPNSLGFYDFKAKTWELVDLAGEKEFIEILEKYEKECDEQILERLLALNLERAAEEQKAAKVKKPKASREKRDDEMV